MLEKKTIFSKLNINDYNQDIENTLEKKGFSEEAENLLLSMFYKIESCYKDYEIVKNGCETEKEFIEKLLKIIENNCNEIIVLKPIIGKRSSKYKVNKTEKRIEVFPNETNLLQALFLIGGINISKENEITFLNKCMLSLLNQGFATNNSEVIRDFTGWSWDIIANEIDNISNNIFYKNMLFLLGNSFIQENINNVEIEEVIEKKFIYIFGEEQGKIAIKKMQQCLLAIYSNINNIKKKNVLLQIEKIKNQLRELEDKPQFIANLKEINEMKTKKIRKINKILGDIDLTRKEFMRKNESLPEDEKIFSISDYIQRLEKDRKNAVITINENNNLINPLNYSKKLNDVRQELKKYTDLKITKTSNADIDKYLIDFQKIFFEGISNKIKNANTKKELINLVYEFRYYNYLPYNNGVKLRFDRRIEEKWESICIELVEKLLDNNVIDVMIEDGKINYDTVKYIFVTKIVKIENLNIKMTKFNDKLGIEYYDINMLEEKTEIEINNLKNIKIKSERRIKIFV